jgi:hypothetical protein
LPWAFFNDSGELQINDGGVLASAAVFTGKVDLGSNLLVGNAGSTGIAISANGEVTMAAQPAVLATNSAVDSNVTGNGATATVDYDTEVFDQNSDFASDTFTAPVTGIYAVMAGAGFEGRTTAHTDSSVNIVASNRTIRVDTAQATIANPSGSHISSLIDMDAGDTLTITLRNQGESSDVHDIRNYGEGTTFSIYLVA